MTNSLSIPRRVPLRMTQGTFNTENNHSVPKRTPNSRLKRSLILVQQATVVARAKGLIGMSTARTWEINLAVANVEGTVVWQTLSKRASADNRPQMFTSVGTSKQATSAQCFQLLKLPLSFLVDVSSIAPQYSGASRHWLINLKLVQINCGT